MLVTALANHGALAEAFGQAQAWLASHDHPSIAIAEAQAAALVYDYARQRASAARAGARARAYGIPAAIAEASLLEASAAAAQLDHARAVELAENARAIYAATGDVSGQYSALAMSSGFLDTAVRSLEAREHAARALALVRAPGYEAVLPWAVYTLALSDAINGDTRAAERGCDEATTLARGSAGLELLAPYCDYARAIALRHRGDPSAAAAIERALASLVAMREAPVLPVARIERALVRIDTGDLAGARADLDEAAASSIGASSAALQLAYADLALIEGDRAAAADRARRARALLASMHQPTDAADIALVEAGDDSQRVALARVATTIEQPLLRLRAIAALGADVDAGVLAAAISDAERRDLRPLELRLRHAAHEPTAKLRERARSHGLLGLARYLR
jgi:hypothetical protein